MAIFVNRIVRVQRVNGTSLSFRHEAPFFLPTCRQRRPYLSSAHLLFSVLYLSGSKFSLLSLSLSFFKEKSSLGSERERERGCFGEVARQPAHLTSPPHKTARVGALWLLIYTVAAAASLFYRCDHHLLGSILPRAHHHFHCLLLLLIFSQFTFFFFFFCCC